MADLEISNTEAVFLPTNVRKEIFKEKNKKIQKLGFNFRIGYDPSMLVTVLGIRRGRVD